MPTNRTRRFEQTQQENIHEDMDEPRRFYKDSDDEDEVIVKVVEEKTDHLCDARLKQMFNVQN